jgi:hypothetical protein
LASKIGNYLKKDLIVDPANKIEVEYAIESGSSLTDEVKDLS